MEAMPRLPMLAFELKHSPEYVDFGPTLKKYIRDHYGEDPALYNKNFAELDQLRQNAIHVTRDFVGCATLKRYYAQLLLMNGRFAMGEGGEAAITFTWEDNQTGRDHVIADIKFEQACILYNIGALHSNLGAIDTRQNAEGMKVSCTHFQCAAWAFEHLRDHFGCSAMSTDMAHEYLSFHINLMLAQAQECILEKSMIDSRKNTITAKVAAQVVEFYRQAVKNLDQCNQDQIINSRSYKDWKKRIELKIAFYQCITQYYMGRQVEDQQKWGERLAYFQAAQDKLSESVKLAKHEVPEMQEALSFAQDIVGGKLQAAQKDNDFIYHEKIPPIDSLPEVKGAPLVKGIPFDPSDPEIAGPDLFQKLVPMEAHEASSIYSEEKAKLLRAVTEDIGTANTELEQFMTSLQIDPSMFEQVPDRLPQDLLEKCAAMSVRTNAIKDLVDSMSALSGLATEAEMNIKEIQNLMAEDAQKTEEFEKQFGKKMPSTVLTSLVKDCEEHQKKHEQGSQLNATLHAAMNAHITNLKMLALPPDQLQSQLPPAQPPKTPEDENVLTEMRRLLSKVDEMRKQRSDLQNQFRENIQKDDITTVLMAVDSSKESVYKDQLKKHDSLINYIGQNLNAQSNILQALTDANAKFAALRQAITQQSAQRENMIKDLFNSYEKYEELLGKSSKGQEYYRRLNEVASKTLERCRSECKVRQEERDLVMSKYAPKALPPSRPTAPKPGSGSQAGTPSTPTPTSSLGPQPLMDPSQLAAQGAIPPVAGGPTALPTFDGPKLKDFLPFMKPQSFGPKRSSPSPQSLPPGSPDPMLSGPPSFASSASDSPQHRTLTQIPPNMPLDQLAPHGVLGYQAAVAGHPSEVTATDVPGRPDATQQQQQPHPAPPPDVTANLPVSKAGLPQPHHSTLPDVSSSTRDGSPLPSHLANQSQLGGFGGAVPAAAKGQVGVDGPKSGLTSSTESLASTGSYPQGFMPGGPHGLPPPSAISNPDLNWSSLPQHPSVQQYRQSPQPGSALPQQQMGQYSLPHGILGADMSVSRPSPPPPASSVPSPAPSPSPSLSSSSASSGHMGGYEHTGYSSLPPHLASTATANAAVRPGTPPQQVPQQQPYQQPYQQQQPQAYLPQQQQQPYAGGNQPQQQQPVQHYQPQARPQVPVSGPVTSHTPQSMQGYGQQVQVPASIHHQSYPQVPSSGSSSTVAAVSSSFCQQPYGVAPSGMQPQHSIASSGQVPAATNSGSINQAQGVVSGQSHTAGARAGASYPMSAGQFPGQQVLGGQYVSQQQPAQQQMPGMMVAPQQQFPQQHSQQSQPAVSQPSHLPSSQQPFHHQPSQSQPQQFPQGQGPVQGQGQGQYTPGGSQGQSSMMSNKVPGVSYSTGLPAQAGYYPSPAASPSPSQSGPSLLSQQQALGHQQAFQHPQQQQQYPAVSAGGQYPGYNQSQQQFAHGQAPQPASSQSPQVPASNQRILPGQKVPGQQQGLPGSSQQQQFPQQFSQQRPPQQQFPQPGQQVPPQQQQQQFAQQGQQLARQFPQQQTHLSQQGQKIPQQQQQMFSQQGLQLPQQQVQPFPQQQTQFPQQGQKLTQQQQFPQQGQQLTQQQQFPQQGQQLTQQQQQQQFPQQQNQLTKQQQFPQQQYPQPQNQYQQHQYPQSQQIQSQQQTVPGPQPQHSLPPSQAQFPQQQQQKFPQYPAQQIPHHQLPPESQLIFPTPLQPSRVQSADAVQPTASTPPQQGGGAVIPSQPAAPASGHHSLPHQNPDVHQSSSSPSVSQTHSSLPPSPLPQHRNNINAPPSSQQGLVTGPSLMRQESSLDELLSSSPEGSKHTAIPAPIITPKVLTDQEKQQQKEEAMMKGAIVEAVKDPYGNSSVLNKFVTDVETFGKFVDDLSISILGVSRLDTVWKSLIDSQDRDLKKQSIAIARCYPMKNRDSDIMPYDDTRVVLTSTKDDYINASWINDLAPSCPKFVATQAPLNVTMTDFWAMVYELGSEVIVQITSEYESGKKFPLYFPTEKGQQMEQGPIILNLQSVKYRQLWTERNVYLKHSQTKQGRTVIHLQFKMWPVSGFPDEVEHVVRFISEVHNFYHQQRSLLKPVIVHCGNGVGRTGAFLMIYTAMQEVLHGNGLTDILALAKRMLQKRKNLIHKKEQLKFCYDALLCFAEDFLRKRNILVQHPHFEKKTKITEPAHTPSSSDDIILGSVNLHDLQKTVGRLHVHEESDIKGSLPTHPPDHQQGHTPSDPIAVLPDLIQQQTRSDAGIAQQVGGGGGSGGYPGMGGGGGGSGGGSAAMVPQGSGGVADVKSEFSKTHSRSGSNTSQQSLTSLAESGSSRSSPQHGPSSFSHSPSPAGSTGGAGGVAQSLADLQDPSKFTIGKGEQKKRFSKASFDRKGSGAGLEIKPDPTDPLSSLDPMWTIHKPDQPEK